MFNKTMDNFCCTLIIGIFAFFILSWLLPEYSTMKAFGLVSNSDTKSNTPINHVIVISQGKRSFDNYFGTYPGANGFPKNLTVPLNPFIPPSLEFTVATWFNTNKTLPAYGFLVNKGGFGTDAQGKNMNYGIWMNKSGNIIAGFESKNGTDYTVGSTDKYNDGKWHQVVVTYDGNYVLTLFIDGNQTASNQTSRETPDTTGTQPIRIGSNSLNPGNFFTGFIDEVRIWNKPLGYSEVLNGYNNNTYNTDKQFVHLSFDDTSEYKSGNVTIYKPHQLNGIYLNGSSYQDVKINLSQYTSYIKPYHLENTKTEIPYHGSNAYQISYNNGLMNGFSSAQVLNGQDGKLVMGYYDDEELPYYWKFASEFVLADNFFAPTMQTGLTNHQYLYTGTSEDYQKNISFPNSINLNRTIFDELEESGRSWRVYVEDYDPALNYTNEDVKSRFVNLLTTIPRFVDNKSLNSNIVDLVEYFRDLRKDDFPAVAYIVAPSSEESSPRDVSNGQDFVASLVLALMKSKHWKDSTFIITYRESGGWYDHVPPPIIDSEAHGFRIPTLIISPFSKKGYVDNTFYDAASILKFIEYNYGLSPLAKNDANTNNILNAFDFTRPPREPLTLNSFTIQHVNQESKKNIDKSDNVIKVYFVYFIIISSIPAIGLIIWRSAYRR